MKGTNYELRQTILTSPKSKPRQKGAVESFGKVAVLMGGNSKERAVSLESGRCVLKSLLDSGVNAYPIDPKFDLLEQLTQHKFDRVFNILHGKQGEDGVIQGILDYMGIPFTGSDLASSALAMDKIRSKLVFDSLGLKTPIFGVATDLLQAKKIAKDIGYPLAIKPYREGSSLGISKLEKPSDLEAGFLMAKKFDEAVLIEQWIEGVDYFVGILGGKALPSVAVRTESGFYDYHQKYNAKDTQYECPAKISSELEETLQSISLHAFNALGCSAWGRADLVVDSKNQAWLLEMNTLPGLTPTSLVPMGAKAIGLSFSELILQILQTSLSQKESPLVETMESKTA